MISPVKEKTRKVGGSPVVARDIISHKHGVAASRLSKKRVLVALKYVPVELKEALDQVQLLSGLLPICASCKRIKDEREVWQPLEAYIQAHSQA